MQETWNSVTVLNGSDRPMQLLGTGGLPNVSINTLNSLDVLDARSDHQHLRRRRGRGWRREPMALRRQAHLPRDPRQYREHPRPAVVDPCSGAACNLTIFGDIFNIVGTTTIRNDRGNILAGPAGPTFYSNRAFLDSELGSIGTIPIPIRLVLFQITHTGEVGVAAIFKDAVLDLEAGTNAYLELTVLRRSSTTASSADVAADIGPLKAGNDLYVKINDSNEGTVPAVVGNVAVDTYTPNELPDGLCPGGLCDERILVTNHFRPFDPPGNPDIVGCGTASPCVVLVAYGTDTAARNANYTFDTLNVGNRLGIHHPSTATEITYTAFVDGDATWTDDETSATHGSNDNVGKIDMSTNGFIHVIELAGDLRVGHIHSTGICSSGTLCPGETPGRRHPRLPAPDHRR